MATEPEPHWWDRSPIDLRLVLAVGALVALMVSRTTESPIKLIALLITAVLVTLLAVLVRAMNRAAGR